ncbi:MAG: DUF368 domain-containing protein [Bryobacterales bacterium]|nr:DUF368 domain-containing protein [Bryobacterales bacterium]
MGLANLIPGVSGGTMLLAAGIYPHCIEAIAKLTTLRPDRSAIALLAAIAVSAAAVVLFMAGTMRDLVLMHRWMTYSVFLGATLGGVPPLWRLIDRPDARTWLGFSAGLASMLATLLVPLSPAASGQHSPAALFLAGLAAFGAMLLPGLSGSYLLVLSGQYVPVLDAVDSLKAALSAGAALQWQALAAPAQALAPFAAGTLAALVGLSSLLHMLLERQRALMLGFLLGLLVGAVLGLWPFRTETAALVSPTLPQAAGAAALAALGGALAYAIGRQSGAEA